MSHALVTTIPPLTYRSQSFDRMGLLQPSNDTPWEIESRRAGRELNSAEKGRIRLSSDTRYEALGDSVLDDIRHWGRQGKIFHTHFRNVQGTVPSGGYAEVGLASHQGDPT